MKKIIFLFIFLCISTSAFTQRLLDIITLNNGESIECNIIRVNDKSLYYQLLTPPFEINKLSLDEVEKYEFNNMYFQTNPFGILEHSEVIELNGFSQDQIYRALKDWFFINPKRLFDGAYIEDNENFILYGSVTIHDFWNDNIIYSYIISYDVIIRAKNNKFKIILNNFVMKMPKRKTLKNLYETRYYKDKTFDPAYQELIKLEFRLKEQIASAENHCKYIADKDTFKESIIKYMLSNDNW